MHAPASNGRDVDVPQKQHLAAVPSQKRVTDRREARFLSKYVEFSLPPVTDDRPNAKRRLLGYGLKTGPADLYSALIELLGTPYDGKRGDFAPRDPVNASFLRRRYGWTYDQIAAWTRVLERPQPCPHCERGHALLRVHRPKFGGSYRYELIRCQDLPDDVCVPHEAARPVPRKRTGALPGRQVRKTQLALAVNLDPEASGFSDAFSAPFELIGDDDPRTQLVISIARFHALDLRDATAKLVASHAAAAGATTVSEYEAALLRVICSASLAKRPVDELGTTDVASIVNAAPLSSTQSETAPSESPTTRAPITAAPVEARSMDWAVTRCLDLARRAEPRTTIETATRYRDEIAAMLRKHGIHDPQAVDTEMGRILTDPRIVGSIEKPQRTPMRLLRSAMADKEPWILTPAHLDDGAGQLARAYAAIPIGRRDIIERIVADHLAGDPLDRKRLSGLGVSSRQMIAFVIERVRAATT